MDIKSTPIIQTPNFLIDSSNITIETTAIIIFLALALALSIYTRVKKSLKLIFILKKYKKNIITSRETAYKITENTKDLSRDDITILESIKYNKNQDTNKEIDGIITRAIYSNFFGKN